MDASLSRRQFGAAAIQSVALFALVDGLRKAEVFASSIRPFAKHWLAELDELGRELKSDHLKQVEWQAKVEELYSKVDLADFLKLIDFDTLARKAEAFQGRGAQSLAVNFPKIDGVPTKLVFGRQLFAMKKGRSIVPHGHDNMATAFLVVRGRCRGRHFDRLADEKEHMIITPTIDKEFPSGGASSISDYKDNVHWFEALTDSAFVFNIHVMGLPGNSKNAGRVYIDPVGEKLEGGRIRARLIDHEEATKLYG
jgi:hypothetical protein